MTPKPTDAERELYRLGRTGEAIRHYRLRTLCTMDESAGALHFDTEPVSTVDRERRYARAEAAAAIVKAARRWRETSLDPNETDTYMRACEVLRDTTGAYETMIAGEE